jgi:hypothetical protein
MVWLCGMLCFALGAGLLFRGYAMLAADLRSGAASFRIWTAEFWWAHPGYPAMGLSHNARWALQLAGGVAAAGVGWRLVRIAGRMD